VRVRIIEGTAPYFEVFDPSCVVGFISTGCLARFMLRCNIIRVTGGRTWKLGREIHRCAFLVVAASSRFVGSYGLIKLPDPMTRSDSPTKATTLGVGGVLIAFDDIFHLYQRENQLS